MWPALERSKLLSTPVKPLPNHMGAVGPTRNRALEMRQLQLMGQVPRRL